MLTCLVLFAWAVNILQKGVLVHSVTACDGWASIVFLTVLITTQKKTSGFQFGSPEFIQDPHAYASSKNTKKHAY